MNLLPSMYPTTEQYQPKVPQPKKPEEKEEAFDDEIFEPQDEQEEVEVDKEDSVAAKNEKLYERFLEAITRVNKEEMVRMTREDTLPLIQAKKQLNPDQDWEQLEKDYQRR